MSIFFGRPGDPAWDGVTPAATAIPIWKRIAVLLGAAGGVAVDVIDRAGRLLGIVRIQDSAGNALTSTGNDLDVHIPDGGDVAQGATTDAEAAAGNGSVIAVLKRLRTLLNGGLPAALGQGTMAQSLRVVLPSDQVAPVVDRRIAADTVAHRTITALDGRAYPASNDAGWAANPGSRSKARFYVDRGVVRATTGLADDPLLVFRPYLRNGGAAGYVGMGQEVQIGRPRPRDNAAMIKLQKTVNNGVAYTDYSTQVNDNNGATQADINGLDTVANGDWFIVGYSVPFIGVALDLDAANVNANASVLTVEIWTGAAWAAVANMVDGTIAVAGKTLSGDGQVTWDLPAVWAMSTINGINACWARFSVSAALSANVDIEEADILLPIKACIDVDADGDDVLLWLERQDASLSGTPAYSVPVRLSWR